MEKIHSLVHAKIVRLPRRCLKMRLQLYIRAICHGHRCIDGILLSSSANTVGASWLQKISWREPIRDGKIFWMNDTVSDPGKPPPPPPPSLISRSGSGTAEKISFCNQMLYLWNNFTCVLSKFKLRSVQILQIHIFNTRLKSIVSDRNRL